MAATERRGIGLSLDRLLTRRTVWALALGLIGVHVVLAWMVRQPGVETGQDDAVYLLLARGLRGFQYRDLFLVDTPPHRMYPPGYPAVLAAWGALVGDRFDLMIALNIAASATALGLVFATVKRVWSPPVALACLAPLACNPYLVQRAGQLMSEPSYMLLSTASLCLLAPERPARGAFILAGLAAIAAALTRSVGVTLLIAIATYWLLQRRFGAAAVFAAACAGTVGAWLWWTAMSATPYVDRSYFGDAVAGVVDPVSLSARPLAAVLLTRAFHSTVEYLGLIVPYRVPWPTIPGTRIDNALDAVLTVVGAGAGLRVLWSRWRAAALYLLVYAGLLLVWRWRDGRFIEPLLLLVVPAMLLGLGAIARLASPKWELPSLASLALLVAVTAGARTASLIKEQRGCDRGGTMPAPPCLQPDQADYFAALEYVKTHTSPSAVFLAGKPATVYYYTARRSVPQREARLQRPAGFFEFLQRRGVTHVLLGGRSLIGAGTRLRVLEANCNHLRLEARFGRFTYLFRVLQGEPGEESGQGTGCQALALYRSAMDHDPTVGTDGVGAPGR